jgi:Uma2 family endonuclease
MAIELPKRHFNVDEYYRMAEAGILSEDDRVELIEGEIVEMSPIGAHHAACVDRLTALLYGVVGEAAIVRVQNPIRLSDLSEPQPDITLVRPRDDFYASGHPTPADVLLVVEVADTSQRIDRRVKLPLFAKAGIPEVWLVDLPTQVVEAHTEPVRGRYRSSRRAGRGDSLEAHNVPGLALSVDAILG